MNREMKWMTSQHMFMVIPVLGLASRQTRETQITQMNQSKLEAK